jgi:hypothetical protein
MKKLFVLLATLFIVVFALALVQPTQAFPENPISMNAKMTHWQEEAAVIHIMVFSDAGRLGVPAIIEAGKPILFGFEWGGIDWTPESLREYYINNPDTDITVSVDGGPAVSVKSYYQAPFISATKSGPAWSWDHDGDGPGDGDGDGWGDWNVPVLFFRYQHPGLASGTHTLVFRVIDPASPLSDEITVEIVP